MPVQDNENKRTAENSAVIAEEELRKQQMQKQENNVRKSGKLLPFLNAKANHHKTRLENLNEKIATQHDKISKHTTKIEKLSMKAEKLEDTNRMLKSTLGNFPFAKNLIQQNEKRIANIRENKIPNRQQKLQKCHSKLEKFSAKNEQISHKLNRVIALNDRKNAMISQKNQLVQTYSNPVVIIFNLSLNIAEFYSNFSRFSLFKFSTFCVDSTTCSEHLIDFCNDFRDV